MLKNVNEYKLDKFQQTAISEIQKGSSVIVAAPTGSGKTLIAQYAIELALKNNQGIIYTAPLKAISNQKFRDFRHIYGDENVGIVTGDVAINSTAPIIIMTTEIFRNSIFEEDSKRIENTKYVIFDEIHFIDDEERGTVWEESIIFAPPHIIMVCLSATVPNVTSFSKWMSTIRHNKVIPIIENKRPVPLYPQLFLKGYGFHKIDKLKNLSKLKKGKEINNNLNTPYLLKYIVSNDYMPCLYFCPGRKITERLAYRFKYNLLKPNEMQHIRNLYNDLLSRYGIGRENALSGKLFGLIRRGIAYHHAGILPVFKDIIERIFASGLLKLIFTTETFAMGINMPAYCVTFNEPNKFNGIDFKPMTTREYFQMAGRAGRRGIDTEGKIILQCNTEDYDADVIKNMILGKPKPINSRFKPSYSMLLNLIKKLGDDYLSVIQKSFSVYTEHSAHSNIEIEKYYTKILKNRKYVLENFDYVNQFTLSSRGYFASTLNGSEIPLTEFYFEGIMNELDEDYLNILFMAIVFEKRSKTKSKPMYEQKLLRLQKKTRKIIRRWRKLERTAGLPVLTSNLDFSFSIPVYAFSRGEDFKNLKKYTNFDDGDIVRYMRLAIQLIRQLIIVTKEDTSLNKKLRNCLIKLRRDVIDPEKQLLTKIE